jgi:hypothetical protein
MFVVWRSRERQLWDRTRHAARLVESVRVRGKPRQRFIAQLGSYEEYEGPTPADTEAIELRQRLQFWRSARSVLDHLAGRLSADERAEIEAALALRIAPPSKAEVHQDWAEGRAAIGMAMSISADPGLAEFLKAHMASEPEKPDETL